MKDRIRLAEAMGWTQIDMANIGPCWHSPRNLVSPLPDPFTDANDDVAILNLALTMEPEWAMEFFDELKYDHVAEYKVGHFARAALQVLDSD